MLQAPDFQLTHAHSNQWALFEVRMNIDTLPHWYDRNDYKQHSKRHPKGKKNRKAHHIANMIKLERCHKSGATLFKRYQTKMPAGHLQCLELYERY